jgi:hypothetical protein
MNKPLAYLAFEHFPDQQVAPTELWRVVVEIGGEPIVRYYDLKEEVEKYLEKTTGADYKRLVCVHKYTIGENK